jgi:predicted nucleotidyltransferase
MNKHQSGFNETLEGQQIPMRIMKILDSLTLEQKPENYITIINEISSIIEEMYQFQNVYHINQLTTECLYYIKCFNFFKEIHGSTVWTLSDMREKKKRDCSICAIT